MSARGPGRPRATSRAEIRDIAVGLFAQQGYSATSLEQIATAAAISRTTLFSYFPAKRDLIWAELIQRAAAPPSTTTTADEQSVVDLIVRRILDLGRYPASDRDALALRWRIVQEDDELRAYSAAQSGELARVIVDEAVHRAPECDPQLVDHVTHALIAVSMRCTEEWARGAGRDQDLEIYTGDQLRSIATVLRPLLP